LEVRSQVGHSSRRLLAASIRGGLLGNMRGQSRLASWSTPGAPANPPPEALFRTCSANSSVTAGSMEYRGMALKET